MDSVSKITWFEERNLKCSISLKPSSMGEVTFTYIDEAGSEYEITAPDYSLNINPAAGSGISRSGSLVSNVGRTSLAYTNGHVYKIGNTTLHFAANNVISGIGSLSITFSGRKVMRIGNISVHFSGDQVSHVGNASIMYSGSTVARISGNVK